MKIVIVGGVAGGASAAARARRLDEHAEIIIFERGSYISFANCGLPYFIGGEITDSQKLTLQTPQSFRARFNIDVRVRSEVISVDPQTKQVLVRREDDSVYSESYDKLILSPGAEPIRPNWAGIDSERVFTLRNIPDSLKIKQFIIEQSPKRAVVIGGGYIGMEMAENLVRAGLSVSLIEAADHLIASLDAEMAADVHRYVREQGVTLALNSPVSALSEQNGELLVKAGDKQYPADMVLLAIGVRPESMLAGSCGLRLNARGAIVVDRHMRTSEPDIYAVGDAVEITDFVGGQPAMIPLAGPANKQGRIAADNICGIPSEYGGTQGSAVLKLFDMTIASTGISERTAKSLSLNYDKTYIYSGSHASYYPKASNISIKALWEKGSLKLLGAQLVGFDGVDKRADVLATALRFGAKITDLAQLELCYAPPYGSAKDPVNMLGFIGENVASGRLSQFFLEQVDSLPRDGSVTLLDVRTKAEYARGSIEGFINIPLDELRENLSALPKDKPIYLHCHSGMRSYIACCLLTGYGYRCFNLAGGWRLYEVAKHECAVTDYNCRRDK